MVVLSFELLIVTRLWLQMELFLSYNGTVVFEEILIEVIQKSLSPLEALDTNTNALLERLPGIKALLFDVYGTLLISEAGDISLADSEGNGRDLEGRGAQEALEKAGYAILQKKTGKRALELYRDSISAEHSRLRLTGIDVPEVDIREIWKTVTDSLKKECFISGHTDNAGIELLSLYYELYSNKVWPMPGAVELLSLLSQRDYHLGIVSNAQFYTPLSLHALLGGSEASLGFEEDLVIYSYRLRRAKPSAGIFAPPLKVLHSRYGIEPEEVLYIGNDMRNDIMAAQKAGCKTVLFAGDRRSLRLRSDIPECRTIHPHRTITRLDQLLTILETNDRRKIS